MGLLDQQPPFKNDKNLLLGVFFLSFCAFSFQTYLSCIFSVIFSEGLVFFPTTIAFLGFGIAGIALYLSRSRFLTDAENFFFYSQVCLIAAVGLFLFIPPFVSRHIDKAIIALYEQHNIEFLRGDRIASGFFYFYAFLLGLIAAIPFFLFGLCLSACFKYFPKQIHKIYFVDLGGAGVGCVAGVLLMPVLGPTGVNTVIVIFLILSCFLFLSFHRSVRTKRRYIILLSALIGFLSMVVVNAKTDFFEIKLDPRIISPESAGSGGKTHEIWHKWNAYSRIGLWFIDNENSYEFIINRKIALSTVLPYNPEEPYVLRHVIHSHRFSPAGATFSFQTPKDVLVIFAGAGRDLVEAYAYSRGSSNLTGVEINPLIVHKALSMPQFHLKEFFQKPNVRLIVREGRDFLNSDKNRYDAIILSYGKSPFTYNLGLAANTTEFLFTREAFREYLRHLKPEGTLTVMALNQIQPLVLAKTVFEESGIADIQKKVVVLTRRPAFHKRNNTTPPLHLSHLLDTQETDIFKKSRTGIVIFKKTDFSYEEVEAIGRFAKANRRTLAYGPFFTTPTQKAYKDLLETKDLARLLKDVEKKYHMYFRAADDDRPYIWNLFPLRAFFSRDFWLTVLRNPFSNPLYSNNLFLFFVFGSILFLVLALLVIPLTGGIKTVFVKGDEIYIAYFSAIGFGYILIEIFLMQTLSLFLGHPIYAFSLVLSSFLVSSGIGGFFSRGLFEKRTMDLRRLTFMVLSSLALYYLISVLFRRFMIYWDTWAKICIAVPIISALGFLLGMYFPVGLRLCNRRNSRLIPFLWSVDHIAAILGSIVSIFLSIYGGFRTLLYCAGGIYALILLLCRSKYLSQDPAADRTVPR